MRWFLFHNRFADSVFQVSIRANQQVMEVGNCETLSGTDADVQSIQKRAPDAVASRPFFVQIVHPLFLEREFCNRLVMEELKGDVAMCQALHGTNGTGVRTVGESK